MVRLKRRLTALRVGDPLDKNTDIGAINSSAQLAKIRELSEIGDREGAERWSPPCELPDRGYWFPPTVFTGVTQAHRIAREEIFGPVLSVLTFRTPEEAVEKANNTPFGLSAGVWTEKGSRILWMAQRLRAGVVWANTFNKFDPTSPFGGYKESGYGREGGRHGLEAYLDVWSRILAHNGRRRPQDLQALHRGRVPEVRVGPHLRDRRRARQVPRQRCARVTQGRGDAVVATRGSVREVVGRDHVQPRADPLPHRRDARRAASAVHRRGTSGRRRAEAHRREGRRRGHRPVGLVRGMERQDRPGERLVEPRRGIVLRLLSARADGVVAVLAPQESSLLGLVSVVAPVIVTGNTCVVVAAERGPLPAISLAEVLATSDPPAGVVNMLTGGAAELAPWLAAHMDVNAIDLCGAPPGAVADLERAAADNLKRVVRPGEREPDWFHDPGLDRMLAFLETKTVWHPIGV